MNRQPLSVFAVRPTAHEEWKRGGSVVASAHVGMATGAGLYFYTSSLFVIPLSEQYGWSRGDIAMGAALGLLGSLTAPLIGRMTDRLGARLIAATSFLLMLRCSRQCRKCRARISISYCSPQSSELLPPAPQA
ncbi:MAG: hypothetical protein KKD08_04660 [Alphaproteobacteria bacterium]|nr:hypothetical protein [Alphaproteobacteria bacterium]